MTIIASDGMSMAADSVSFHQGILHSVIRPKLIRAPDGGVCGAAGASGDIAMWQEWVENGMAGDQKPKLSFPDPTAEQSILWIWLMPSGAVHMGDCTLNNWPVPTPVVIGCGAEYVYGLLDGGVSLGNAVAKAIARVPYLGGSVQIEYPSTAIRETL